MQYQTLAQIGDVLTQASDNFWCKNTTGEYFGVGQAFVQYSGLSTANDIVGRTDYQLPWCDFAPIIDSNDQATLARRFVKMEKESITTAHQQTLNFLVAKFPLYNQKHQLLGTMGCAFPLDGGEIDSNLLITDITLISENLLNLGQALFDTLKKRPPRLSPVNGSNKHSFMLNGMRIFFTEREIFCLGFLVLGKGAKETGQLMNVSAKTVEYYLQRIKQKLKCYHRSQIITLLYKEQVAQYLVQMVEACK